MNTTQTTLRSKLNHEPQILKFGTSGRRGEVVHLTQLEVYLNALAELEYLQALSVDEGGIVAGDDFYFALDLRPSSIRYVEAEQGRGELAQAIVQAIRDAGMKPINLGQIPTPALTAYATALGKGSIMVTGSHIPFDRNGYKVNTSRGELLKIHEGPINERVRLVRERLYSQPYEASLFDENGRFKTGHQELPPVENVGEAAYIHRYVDFFGDVSLEGTRLLVYQHSAVGRDLLVDILRRLGADAIPAGRSETFIPIDTENMDEAQLQAIQALYEESAASHGRFDAIVSTDGDSDRPLILGVNEGKVRFFGGDLIGMVTAQYLGADAIAVPISCNDAIDRGALKDIVLPKTKIGSPFVIARMEQALALGKRAVCGFEANGGFLTGSVIERKGRSLAALPTRDALLPILAVLYAAKEQGLSLSELFDRLPTRYSRAALIKQFPRPVSVKIVERFSPAGPRISEAMLSDERIVLLDAQGKTLEGLDRERQSIARIAQELSEFFTPAAGFGSIAKLNYVDGVRIYFSNGEVAHLRPSGNADELRIYAVTDKQDRSDAIAKQAIAEPDGILRRLEQRVVG